VVITWTSWVQAPSGTLAKHDKEFRHLRYIILLRWWICPCAPLGQTAIVLAHSQSFPVCGKLYLHDPVHEGVASSCSLSSACLVGGSLHHGFVSPCSTFSFSITMRFFPLFEILLHLPSHLLVLFSEGIYLFFVLASQFFQLMVHLPLHLCHYCTLIVYCSCRHHLSWE